LLGRRASVREAAARAVIALVSRAGAEEAERIAQRLGEFARAHAEVESGAVVWIEDAAPDAKLAAVQFAALLRTPEAACALVQCGGDAAVAGAARIALSALGAALPGALARAWPRLSPAERAFACGALATCGDAPSAERMLRTTLLDPASEVRAAAARALGACATSASFGELLGRLAQEDPRASREAQEDECDALVEAVVQLAQREGGEAVDAAIALVEARLLGADERARAAGARLLAQLARPADAGRVRALLGDASERVRRCAVEAVVGLGHAAGSEELLRVALADEAPGVRGAAAHAVARLGLASAEGDLAVLAGDRDARVRAAAMSALAVRARVPEARAAALQMLATGVGGDGIVALAALAALQQIGGTDAAALAAAGLRSAEPEIVEAAVGCVGAHGGEALRGELIGLLAHPAWPVRARAARELAEQRAAAALPQLHARLAEERDEFVREALLAALAALES
jgi:HEAT repeat protein